MHKKQLQSARATDNREVAIDTCTPRALLCRPSRRPVQSNPIPWPTVIVRAVLIIYEKEIILSRGCNAMQCDSIDVNK